MYQIVVKRLEGYLPNLGQSWILLLLTAFAGMFLGGICTFILKAIAPSLDNWITTIIYPIVFIPPALYIYAKTRFNNNPFEGRNRVPIDSGRFGKLGAPLTFTLILILIFSYNIVIEPLHSWMGLPGFLKDLFNNIKESPYSTFISIVIFAPLLEELLCRGIILRGLLQSESVLMSIFWSATIFAVMHLNPWQALPAFLLGLLMGWVYWRTGSLWATIFIHFINNGFSFFVTILFPYLEEDATFASIMPEGLYPTIYIFSIAITAIIILIVQKSYDKVIPTKI